MLGYFSTADGNGDYYQLGNLAAGTQVGLNYALPLSSHLSPKLEIYKTGGVLVTNNLAGQTNLSYTVETGAGGAYFGRVSWYYPRHAATETNGLLFNG